MRYLITGGAGFIGSHLADALVARGDSVLVLDDLSTGSVENVADAVASGQAEFVEGSVCDEALVDECMERADACFHLASAVGVKLIVDRSVESLSRSVRGAQVVTEGAHRLGRRLLFASTSEIYGKNGSDGLTEHSDRILGPPSIARWSYSTAKAFGEAISLGYHREREADTVVARLFNTVGPRQTGAYGMVLPRFVGQAIAGEDLTVYGDGSQSRCFAHVDDTTRALVMLMDEEGARGTAFNVGRSTEITILELARDRDRAHRIQLGHPHGALRGGLRRGLRGARPPPPRHLGARADDRLAARRSGSRTRSTTSPPSSACGSSRPGWPA